MKILSFLFSSILILGLIKTEGSLAQSAGIITGELKKWHPITITFDGPVVSETDEYNPFLGYRLNVTFRHENGMESYIVPGYFAADGNAAETSAASGNKWRVHFTPRLTGRWTYIASFRRGDNIAVNLSSTAGEPLAFNGASGTLVVSETDKTGRDNRGKGMLRYVGEHYLRFDNGEWFMKGGVDEPESLFAYEDFDGTYLQTGSTDHSFNDLLLWGTTQHSDRRGPMGNIKSYNSHLQDWNEGDPVWQGDKGKGIIGALNYLSDKGLNAFSFIPNTAGGDSKSVWPWINHMEMDRYDVSKLAQWEIVFTHADRKGLFIHFKLQENENLQLLDGGSLGMTRKLYYRELVARFSHHHALNWNLGEEHDLARKLKDTEMKLAKADAKYLHTIDPYNHPVVIHSYPWQYNEVLGPLLGFEYLEGISMQTRNMQPWNNFNQVNDWVNKSNPHWLRKWVVSLDEAGSAPIGVSEDDWDDNYNQDWARAVYWGTIAAGGAGMEWYTGEYNGIERSGNYIEDFRKYDALWDYTNYAMCFYRDNEIPFWQMTNANNLTKSEKDFVFAKPGEIYVIYLPDGGASTLNLENHKGIYSVEWYNPRKGGDLQKGRVFPAAVKSIVSRDGWSFQVKGPDVVHGGNVIQVSGPGWVSLGIPPTKVEEREDWVILVRKQ